MAQPNAEPTPLQAFLLKLWPDAAARGVNRATFDAAFAGFMPDERVLAATRRQPEFNRAIGVYINGIATPQRIEGARQRAATWAKTLQTIEAEYEVDRWIILALWGIETSFGANTGSFDVIRSLATLALSDYRPDYFRDELLAALQVLQDGHIARDKMRGSWAGAMGQPQFMPSNLLSLAVDVDGDGRKNIWTSVPDVLASIANYMRHHGWKPGLTWGCEVLIPKSFDFHRSRATFADWAKLGVKRADGKPLRGSETATLYFPSGARGPAFLVTSNFVAIKHYNNSDSFALAVSHLADRARGEGPVRAVWPAQDPQLARSERIALQRKLAELGYTVNDFEGRFDFDLRDNIREQQVKFGMRPDGHPTQALLQHLGIVAR